MYPSHHVQLPHCYLHRRLTSASLALFASARSVPQPLLDSVKALQDLAQAGIRVKGAAEGWSAVAGQAKTIADALRTGESRAAFIAHSHRSRS